MMPTKNLNKWFKSIQCIDYLFFECWRFLAPNLCLSCRVAYVFRQFFRNRLCINDESWRKIFYSKVVVLPIFSWFSISHTQFILAKLAKTHALSNISGIDMVFRIYAENLIIETWIILCSKHRISFSGRCLPICKDGSMIAIDNLVYNWLNFVSVEFIIGGRLIVNFIWKS